MAQDKKLSEFDQINIVKAKKISSNIGYPVLIKASAGGGGKGMKLAKKSPRIIKNPQSEFTYCFWVAI